MTSPLPAFRIQVPIGRVQPDGTVLASDDFSRWLNRPLRARIGGETASTNIELAKQAAAAQLAADQLLVGEMVFQGVDIQPAYPDVVQQDAFSPLGETTFQS